MLITLIIIVSVLILAIFLHLIEFVFSLFSGFKYGGFKRYLILFRNIAVNRKLQAGTLTSKDRSKLIEVNNKILLEIFLSVMIFFVFLPGMIVCGLYIDGKMYKESLFMWLFILFVTIVISFITYMIKKDDVNFKYYKLQYGTVINKEKRYLRTRRYSGTEYLYMADILLSDGNVYREAFVYDEGDYEKLNSGKTECIVYAKTRFKTYAIPIRDK